MTEPIRRDDVAKMVRDWKQNAFSSGVRHASSYDGMVRISNVGDDILPGGPIRITGLGLYRANDIDAYNEYLTSGVLLSGEPCRNETEEKDIIAVSDEGIEAGTIGRAHLPGCFGAWLDDEHNAEYSRVGMTEDGFCDSEDGQFEYVAGVGRFAVLRTIGGDWNLFLAHIDSASWISCNRWSYSFRSCEIDENGTIQFNDKEYGLARNVYELGLPDEYNWNHKGADDPSNLGKSSVQPVFGGTLVWMRKLNKKDENIERGYDYIFQAANQEGNCVLVDSRRDYIEQGSKVESIMFTPHIMAGNFLEVYDGGDCAHSDCGDGRIALLDWTGMRVSGYKIEITESVTDINTSVERSPTPWGSIYEMDGNDESSTISTDLSGTTTETQITEVDAENIKKIRFSKSFSIEQDSVDSSIINVYLKSSPGADPEDPDEDILEKIQDKLEELQTSISIHTTTITTLTELTETHETTITELQTSITELQTSISELTQTVTTHTSQITAIQQSITNLQSEIETISTTVETHETEITTLQSTITSIQESITSLQTTIESHTTSISTLQRLYSEIEQSVTALTTRISNIETSITSLQTSVSTISGTVQQIQMTVSSLATAVYEIQQTLSSLQGTVSGHTSSITYIQQSIGSGGGSGGWGGGVGSVTYSPVTFSPASPSFSAPTLSQSGQLTIPYYTNPQAVLSYISSLIAKINTLESSYQTLQTRIHTLETQVQQMDPAKYDYEEAEVVTNVECVNNEIQVTKTEVTLMTPKENGGAE